MSDKPKLNTEIEEADYDMDSLTEGLGYFEDRDRISFGTNLNAGVKEKLKTISEDKDMPMADIINSVLKTFIKELEKKEGKFEVYDLFRVEE